MNKNEWIGGKQIYPPQDNTNNEDDNWWDLDSEEFGIGVSEENNDNIQMGE